VSRVGFGHRAWLVGGGLRLGAVRGAEISFGALLAQVVVLQLSRLLRSFVGLGGPDEWGSLPGRVRAASCGSAGRFEGLLAGEDVPGGDQDLACDGRFGGVGFAVAVLGVGV
jgi:hypothetical protein